MACSRSPLHTLDFARPIRIARVGTRIAALLHGLGGPGPLGRDRGRRAAVLSGARPRAMRICDRGRVRSMRSQRVPNAYHARGGACHMLL